MDAQIKRLAFLFATITAAIGSMGASARSTNFICSAPDANLAQQVCIQGEAYRKELAIKWLGRELPAWDRPCPIRITEVGPHVGAGGATRIAFDPSQPHFEMTIQGSYERILDSVLPHEITHTIFASHFRRPLPRWADEGACTTVEHESERARSHQMLLQFLTSRPSRGIAFNRMFAMTEYPKDIMPLYSQGYSLTRFLIHQGGEQKFVRYVGDGMSTNDWTSATQKHYGFDSLSDLQVEWLSWVRNGSSPEIASRNTGDIRTLNHEGEIKGGSDNAYWNIAKGVAQPESTPSSPPQSAEGMAMTAVPGNYPANGATTGYEANVASPTQPNHSQQLIPLPPVNSLAEQGQSGWYRQQKEAVQQQEAIAREQHQPYTPGSIGRTDNTMLSRPQPVQQTTPRALPPRTAGERLIR